MGAKKCLTLNWKQESVVAELKRNILMLASAGTGKTNTMAQRVSNILNQTAARPEQILCITFTNRACKEMKDRVVSVVGKDGRNVVIKTIHSFCYDIIKTQAKEKAERYSDFVIFDEMDCLEIIKKITKELTAQPATVQRFIEMLKTNRALYDFFSEDERRDYEKSLEASYTNHYDRLLSLCYKNGKADEGILNELLKEGVSLICSYNRELKEMNALDFDDLLIMAYTQIKEPKAREFWSKRFKYINVDEAQDVNMLEFNILDIIFCRNNVLICGDYFQTIYQWRGSDPNQLLMKYIEKYNPVEIVLNQNYRATKTLVQASFGALTSLFGTAVFERYEDGVIAESSNKGEKIRLYSAYDIKAEAQWILRNIREANVEDISKICILARTNKYCTELSSYLQAYTQNDAGLDFMVVDEFRFFRRVEIKDLLAFIKLFLNKYDTISLKRVLMKYARGIGEKTIEELESLEYAECGLKLTDFLEKGSFIGSDPFHYLLSSMGDVIVFDVESTGINTIKDEIIQIAAIKLDGNGNVKSRFERFIKPTRTVGDSFKVHGFSDEFLNKNGSEPKSVLLEFLSYSRNCIAVGHNINYDISILTSQLLRNNLPKPSFTAVYDTLDIFRRYYPNLKNHKLEFLSSYFSLKHKSSHDASDDIEATRELLLMAVNKCIKPFAFKRQELIGRHIHKFERIYEFVNGMHDKIFEVRPAEIIQEIINVTKIKQIYSKNNENKKVANIDYFARLAKQLDALELNPKDSLMHFLSLASLSNSELDTMLQETQKIPIITVHQAKGMEFDYVFLAGMQQSTFPLFMSLAEMKKGNVESYNEEKRVFYVAVTRAKAILSISYSSNIGRYSCAPSEFIKHIPCKFINEIPR